MRVLVACEFSGTVREAFAALGHDAWSCDLLPTEIPSANHVQGDALKIIDDDWDLVIAHPPCTHLAVSGARHFFKKKNRQWRALHFFCALLNAPAVHLCVENPVSVAATNVGPCSQIIQPWQFGHEETKTTCLWLKNLPPLRPTRVMAKRDRNLTATGQNALIRLPQEERWRARSKTYQGVADAMASQWGGLEGYKTGFGLYCPYKVKVR